MRTFSKTTSGVHHHERGLRVRVEAGRAWLNSRFRRIDPAGQDGFLLIEVLISALLVALIVIATFNGFDVATRLSADQRHHSEAALLVAESQEQLRSEPATALDLLETSPHTFTKVVDGTTYTITQKAKPFNATGNATGCSASESTRESGANFEVISSATWPLLVYAKRPAVKQVSVITPPVGSALEVDVINGAEEGVGGVTATAKFLPSGSGTYTTAEGTTSAPEGCVVLSGLASTIATVEIAEKLNFVTETGDLKYPTKEVTIAPNITTHYKVPYAEGGRIKAQFEYKKAPVAGDTFTAFNTAIPAGTAPYVLGSTGFKYESTGEENYLAKTGTYAELAYTPSTTHYASGDLFPFEQPWTVSAGDCPKNDTISEARGSIAVTSGKTAVASVPLSILKLSLRTKNYANAGTSAVDSSRDEVVITDTECEGYETPDNATGLTLTHSQFTASGALEHPYLPFGKQSICVYGGGKTYTSTFTNATATGSALTIYTGQQSAAERVAEEAPGKEKRATEEKNMATAKSTRETTEASERSTWRSQESARTITKAQRESKEATQTSARTAKETEETNEKNRRTTEETAATKLRETREKEEQTAEKETKVTVESGQTSC